MDVRGIDGKRVADGTLRMAFLRDLRVTRQQLHALGLGQDPTLTYVWREVLEWSRDREHFNQDPERFEALRRVDRRQTLDVILGNWEPPNGATLEEQLAELQGQVDEIEQPGN